MDLKLGSLKDWVVPYLIPQEEDPVGEIEKLYKDRDTVCRDLRDLLPIEIGQRDMLEEELKKINYKINTLRTAEKSQRIQAETGFQPLSWDIFKLCYTAGDRGIKNLPVFMVVKPFNKTLEYGIKAQWDRDRSRVWVNLTSNLTPMDILPHIRYLSYLPRIFGETWGVEISSRFSGSIPDEARQLIRFAQKTKLFQEIYLFCQVDKWRVRGLNRPQPKVEEPVLAEDPLIVGYFSGSLWLVGDFDLAPLEEYVKIQYTLS